MKSVVLFSGGLDSTVLLAERVEKWGKGEVGAISFDYGQRHHKEVDAATKITDLYGVKHMIVVVTSGTTEDSNEGLFRGSGSSQVEEGVVVPKGYYTDPSMRTTFVPNRNMIMLSLASAWAISQKAEEVVFAAHAGDHAIYPDCREPFVFAFEKALKVGNYEGAPDIECPFVRMTKAEIVALGTTLKVPFELTWSCYEGGEFHCGTCGTCVERKEAFQLAGVMDPTEYRV